MARMKPLRPSEILAIVLGVPSLVLGAIVLVVSVWPPAGPGENGMAIVIPCGFGSIGLFALFLVVAAAARLRWWCFVGIAGLWVGMCLAMYVSGKIAIARRSDPQPLIVQLTRADVLYSEANQPLYFVPDDKARSEYLRSRRIDPDVNLKQICVVGEAAMRCLAEKLEHGNNSQSGNDERIVSFEVVRASGSVGGSVTRSGVLWLLESLRECVDGPARERVLELKAAIEAKGPPVEEKK